MGTYTIIKTSFEILILLYKLKNCFGKGDLTGIWCSCWQHDKKHKKEYEIGSIKMYQLGNKVIGEIYCGSRMWSFKGKFLHRVLICKYNEWSESIAGFELKVADEGKNINRLQGKWSGSTHLDGKLVKATDLLFHASRGDYCSLPCHLKKFRKDNKSIGVCLKDK